jgi:hypothetical protein
MFLSIALGDLVSEEIRGWLDRAPQAIVRLAVRRLDPESREFIYQEVWLPDLYYYLRGDESRPITRLVRGTTFAIGLLFAASRIARDLVAAPTGPVANRRGTEFLTFRLSDGRFVQFTSPQFAGVRLNLADTVTAPFLVEELAKRGYPDMPGTFRVIGVREPPSFILAPWTTS